MCASGNERMKHTSRSVHLRYLSVMVRSHANKYIHAIHSTHALDFGSEFFRVWKAVLRI